MTPTVVTELVAVPKMMSGFCASATVSVNCSVVATLGAVNVGFKIVGSDKVTVVPAVWFHV